MLSKPPKAGEFTPGGELDAEDITCDRCDDLATRSYEGIDTLDLCDRCYEDLGRWLTCG